MLFKILYDLSVYAASASDLPAVQSFLKRCHKRRHTSVSFNIFELLENSDRRLFDNLNVVAIRYIICFLGIKIHRRALEIDPASDLL